MNLKRFKNNTVRLVSVLAAVTLFGASGCVGELPSGQTGKDDDTEIHAQVTGTDDAAKDEGTKDGSETANAGGEEDDTSLNNTDANNSNDNNTANAGTETRTGYSKDSCGFTITNPGSFADRAQGLYKFVSDGDTEEFVEIYDIGDNLYAYYSGHGIGAMEFFANDAEGFASKTADTMEVKIVSFSSMSQYGGYMSDGLPAIMNMTLTENGIKFSGMMQGSGDCYIENNTVLERVDTKLGHINGFAYAEEDCDAAKHCESLGIETTDNPDEIVGSWILLGDVESGVVMEFTKEGYVQAYLKNTNIEAALFRGTYATGKEKVNGGTNVYLYLRQLGHDITSSFNFCYKKDGDNLMLVKGNETYGEDIAWENATFIPFDMINITRKVHDEEALADQFGTLSGTYYSEDEHMLIITSEGYFMFYNSIDFSDYSEFAEGHIVEMPGTIELYETSYKEGDDIFFGYLTLLDHDHITLTLKETNKTIEFSR